MPGRPFPKSSSSYLGMEEILGQLNTVLTNGRKIKTSALGEVGRLTWFTSCFFLTSQGVGTHRVIPEEMFLNPLALTMFCNLGMAVRTALSPGSWL